jgi:hypothetical protein
MDGSYPKSITFLIHVYCAGYQFTKIHYFLIMLFFVIYHVCGLPGAKYTNCHVPYTSTTMGTWPKSSSSPGVKQARFIGAQHSMEDITLRLVHAATVFIPSGGLSRDLYCGKKRERSDNRSISDIWPRSHSDRDPLTHNKAWIGRN